MVRNTISRLFPKDGAARILNIGCGNGLFFDELEAFGQVEGVEPFLDRFPPAATGRRIHQRPWNRDIDLGRHFDLILALDVIEHVEDDRGFLTAMVRHLAPGGRLLLTVPAYMALWTQHDEINHHLRRYSPEQLGGLFRECGLTGSIVPCFHALGLVKFILNRVETPVSATTEDALPAIPPPGLNRLLSRFCIMEHHLARFVKIPFGSSLLSVAAVAPV